MSRKKKTHYSGIGGQAVLEGIMMKNKDQYAVAVRKPNGEIEVEVEHYIGVLQGSRLKEIPFIRGVFQFLEVSGFHDPGDEKPELFRVLL